MRSKVRPATIVGLLVAVTMGLAVLDAAGFPFRARLYPMVIGSLVLVLAILFVVRELRRGAEKEEQSGATTGAMDIEIDRSIPVSVIARKATKAFAWFLGLYLAIWLLGFKLAVVVFLAAFVAIEARAKWSVILGLTAVMVFAMFMLERFLGVFWLEGLLNQWLQEPLPWLF